MLVENLGRGAIGMFFLIFVCFVLSNNRKAINWKLVIIGLLAQIMFAMGVLHTTVYGVPVFWLFINALLIYTIFRKSKEVSNGTKPITFDNIYLAASVLWQVLLVVGILL